MSTKPGQLHLHPQLQTVLMRYLQQLGSADSKDSVKSSWDSDKAESMDSAPQDGQHPEEGLSPDSEQVETGRLSLRDDQQVPKAPAQVFVTSHSPVLAAQARLESVSILYHDLQGALTSYALVSRELDDNERGSLRRFLDVTKAQLFFGRGVILVEGISEALLIPEMARMLGSPLVSTPL